MIRRLFKRTGKETKRFELWFENHDEKSNKIILHHVGAGILKGIHLEIKLSDRKTLHKTIEEIGPCMTVEVNLNDVFKESYNIQQVVLYTDHLQSRFAKTGSKLIEIR